MAQKLSEKLSILSCRYLFDSYEGVQRVESDGFSEKVYLFNADITLGLTTDWKHILLNKKLFEDEMNNSKRQMFLHEKGHKERGTIELISGWIPYLIYYFFGPLLLIISLISLGGNMLLGRSLLGITTSQAWKLLYTLPIILLLATTISYIIEIRAELFSLEYMSPSEFKKAKKAQRKIQNGSEVRLDLNQLTHPSPDLVLKINSILNTIRA